MKTKFFSILAGIALIMSACGEKTTPVTEVKLNKTTAELPAGQTLKLEATLNEGAEGTIVWATENAEIATVDNGVVTPVSFGTTNITATCEGFTAKCAVTVVEGKAPFTLSYKDAEGQLVELTNTTTSLTLTKIKYDFDENGLMPFDGKIVNNTEESKEMVMRVTRDRTKCKVEACVGVTCLPDGGDEVLSFEGDVDAEGETTFESKFQPKTLEPAADYTATFEFFEKGNENIKYTVNVTYKWEPAPTE